MSKRALESPATGRGKRIKPSPEILTVDLARPVWRTGQQEVVTWSSQGEVPAVNICLHRAPSGGRRSFDKVLACQAKNSGSYEVLVPVGLTPGQYIVRIDSSVNSAVVADSSEFAVECAGGTPVISEVMLQQLVWQGGSRQQVTWSSQGEVPAVDICLHHAQGPNHARGRRKLVKTLVRKATNAGSHEVFVPDGLTPGQYVVRIESSVNGTVLSDSAEFTVVPTGALPAISTVAVARPVWRTGQQEVTTWSSQGEVPTVDICLHRAPSGASGRCAFAEFLASRKKNSGSREVLVPVGLTPGQYIVRIDSSVNSSVIADSAEFTVDDEHRERCVRYALLLLGLPMACKLPFALIRKVAVAAATD